MLFIGICGASGSGKSTLAEELSKMVSKNILIINQDAYYYDHPDMTFEERCALNYDEPSIFDHDLLLSDIRSLLAGQRVLRKQYDYTNHRRAPQKEEYIEPHDVIILEERHASGFSYNNEKRCRAPVAQMMETIRKSYRTKVRK